ncbi:MAG: hypothetical protein HY903_12495 [Deltaproteobacteria bacterium]|nr:hypothetical protein [Deltaproteobacteria bacterium]
MALNIAVGASIALAARLSLRDQPLWRASALWALVIVEGLVMLPTAVYLLWRFPAWSLMYVLEPGAAGLPTTLWAAMVPFAAFAAFLGVRRLLLTARLIAGAAVGVVGLVLVGLVVYHGRAQLLVVGTTEAFRTDPAQMRSIFDTPLLYLLPPMAVAGLLAWGMTLWRLVLLGFTRRAATIEVSPSQIQPLTGKGAGTRRKSN